jgi:hypothetical protein
MNTWTSRHDIAEILLKMALNIINWLFLCDLITKWAILLWSSTLSCINKVFYRNTVFKALTTTHQIQYMNNGVLNLIIVFHLRRHHGGFLHFNLTTLRDYFFPSFPVVDWFVYTYEFWLSLWKIVRSSVILLLPLFPAMI